MEVDKHFLNKLRTACKPRRDEIRVENIECDFDSSFLGPVLAMFRSVVARFDSFCSSRTRQTVLQDSSNIIGSAGAKVRKDGLGAQHAGAFKSMGTGV